MVLKTYGKPLNRFATRNELLLVFHDAVLAHWQLHEVAGILHRDISLDSILINPGGAEGNCGILIDFDHAIRVGDTFRTRTLTTLSHFTLLCHPYSWPIPGHASSNLYCRTSQCLGMTLILLL
ncbi:hypothetical protein JB92DRAFT_1553740 [Gautieria morchelliformis]|nr:hypothetical protein JB92DRAFT_1553740 [Gautieria morchelliformis]